MLSTVKTKWLSKREYEGTVEYLEAVVDWVELGRLPTRPDDPSEVSRDISLAFRERRSDGLCFDSYESVGALQDPNFVIL